jgi:RNA polymerase sigma factor (sigma-70 family)
VYQFYLLAQAEKGNAEAFWILAEHYLPVIFNEVWLLSGSTAETKRMMEQGLLAAWSKIRTMANRGAFQNFLSRTIVETAFSRLRKHKTPLIPGPQDDEIIKEASTPVQAILQLNRLERCLVILRYLENLTLQEIAVLLGKREEQVSEALARILSSLEIPE